MTNVVAEAIQQVLTVEGEMPFSRFMELALYHPSGYYGNSVVIGGEGADFYTASQFPLFGFTLGKYIRNEWEQSGCPQHWQVVEVGAGQGELAFHICCYLRRQMPQDIIIDYVIVEASPHLQGMQRQRLQTCSGGTTRVRWGVPNPELDTVLVANEVLDALPVELMRRTAGGWQRGWVQANGEQSFTLRWKPASTLLTELAAVWLPIPFDTCAELCPSIADFLHNCTTYGKRIVALFIDYGIDSEELRLGIRPSGTIRGYAKHAIVDPLECPGECDITADVLWDHARQAALDGGWDSAVLKSQGKFLLDAGIAVVLERLWQAEGDSGYRRKPATGQFKQLVLPGGMGERFSVLECRRRG